MNHGDDNKLYQELCPEEKCSLTLIDIPFERNALGNKAFVQYYDATF